MTETKSADLATAVTLLSLLLAGLLWLCVMLERPGEAKLRVPLVLEGLPAGLQLASAPPGKLEATVVGPRVLLLAPWLAGSCRLDLSGAQIGASSFSARDCNFGLNRELKVVRVNPALIHLSFIQTAPVSK
jgi:hypothetical protein